MERVLDVPPSGVRRQSEAATALLLIQSRPLTPKRRPASLAAALHRFGREELNLSRFEGLDHNQLSQLLADSEAGIANLANEIGLGW